MEVLQVAHPKTPRKVIVEVCLKLCLISPLQRDERQQIILTFFLKKEKEYTKRKFELLQVF